MASSEGRRQIEARDGWHPRTLMTRADLWDYDIKLRELYHELMAALLNPRPPQLQNTDGDPFELMTMTYELRMSASDAFDWRARSTGASDLKVQGSICSPEAQAVTSLSVPRTS